MDHRALIQPNESPKDYRIRLYKNKALYGLNNVTIGELCNKAFGVNWDESAHRKKTQNYIKGYEDAKSEFGSGEVKLQKMVEEQKQILVEIEKEKVKLRDERNEYKRMLRTEARKESYVDLLKRTIETCDIKPCELHADGYVKGSGKNDLVISCMDLHTGIKIDNTFNEFNEEILLERFQKYLERIVQIQKLHNSENAYVILSELVSGIIHNELRIEANQNLIEQFITAMNIISEFLNALSQYFVNLHVVVCPGNHSRIFPNKSESIKGENLDHLAIPYLMAKLQNVKNIKYVTNFFDESVAAFPVRNCSVFAAHGDKDNIETVVQKFTMMFKVKPDIIYLGHRHTNGLATVYDTKIIQSGCMSGTDNYCVDHRLRNKPEQTVSVIDDDGLVCLYDIRF